MKKTNRDLRAELWIGVAVAVARAENSMNVDSPARWADKTLKEFDETFPEYKQQEEKRKQEV